MVRCTHQPLIGYLVDRHDHELTWEEDMAGSRSSSSLCWESKCDRVWPSVSILSPLHSWQCTKPIAESHIAIPGINCIMYLSLHTQKTIAPMLHIAKSHHCSALYYTMIHMFSLHTQSIAQQTAMYRSSMQSTSNCTHLYRAIVSTKLYCYIHITQLLGQFSNHTQHCTVSYSKSNTVFLYHTAALCTVVIMFSSVL